MKKNLNKFVHMSNHLEFFFLLFFQDLDDNDVHYKLYRNLSKIIKLK